MNKIFIVLTALVSVFGYSATAQCVNTFPYTQDFEASAGGFTAGGFTSFAHGTPAGSTINAAASGTKAWKTNLQGVYNNNETGYVQSPCFDLTAFAPNQVPMLSLKVWYNAEEKWDNANIKYSTNGGTTWQLLGATSSRWYNTPASSMFGPMMEDGWNGNSNGWRYVRQTLQPLAGQNNVISHLFYLRPHIPQRRWFRF
jgi:hypothetical protein